MEKQTYAAAGVNTDASDKLKKVIGKMAQPTFGPEVIGGIGFFGGLYEFKGFRQPVLVSHIDNVGTKVKIALALDKHDTIGIDIVNHCVNDIFSGGAYPVFFQDYIAMGKIVPERVEAIMKGLVSACKETGCALIGGETAEYPGIYADADFYDLVGFVVGVVEKDKMLLGKDIVPGDAVIGLPSSGLHTNGYSLIRRIFDITPKTMNAYYPELGRTLGEALLEPHRGYYSRLKSLLPDIKGLAHITGGSFFKNIPRVLPPGTAVQIDHRTWTVPPLFELIRQRGNVEIDEMYRVYNMGIGMAVICSPEKVSALTKSLEGARVIGEIVKQQGDVRAEVV
jgi:phosphoribosylformylglycinamidine cyclo-ligase